MLKKTEWIFSFFICLLVLEFKKNWFSVEVHMKNIFLETMPEETLETFLNTEENGRENLGQDLPVFVYRMLEYSLKLEIEKELDRESQVRIFRNAGRMAGSYFASHFLDLNLSMDDFVRQLQSKMQEFKMGVLRIESLDEKTGKIILTVAEDADCSGLPVLGQTVCNYDEGLIAGILSTYLKKDYEAFEIDCWATGSRVCRFHAQKIEKNN